MNRTADTIKQSLSMWEVAERYGFEPDRAGFIRCPFHTGDRTASLKIYRERGRGWHCFGCGAGGSVIDFAMKLFDCGFAEAARRLSDDFQLGLYNQTYREKKAARETFLTRQRQLRENEQAIEKAEREVWAALDLWLAADHMARNYAPSVCGGEILPGWVNAVKELPRLYHESMMAEERRWALERASRDPCMGKEGLSDNRTL